MTTDWMALARKNLGTGIEVSSVSSVPAGGFSAAKKGTPPADKTAETPIKPLSSVSSVVDRGFCGTDAVAERVTPLPSKPTKRDRDLLEQARDVLGWIDADCEDWLIVDLPRDPTWARLALREAITLIECNRLARQP